MPDANDRRRLLWLSVAITLLGTLVFLPAVSGSWIFDDRPLIEDNPYVHSLRWAPRWLTHDFWDVAAEVQRLGSPLTYWRPAITATYGLDWQLGGGSPVMFHITNMLAQAGVALLAFVVLRRWIGSIVPAFCAALLFAIHPTKAESVAWISGRTDVLCMLAIFVAAQGMAKRLRGERTSGLALEIGGTALAYLCKEQAIVLPAFAAIEAWIAAGREPIDLKVAKRIVLAALPQALLAAGYLVIRGAVMPIGATTPTELAPLDHVLAILETMGRFMSLTFAPRDLSLQHGLVHSKGGVALWSMPYVVTGAIAYAAMLGIAVALRRRWPVATLGIAFFLFTVAPTANIRYAGMETLVSERFLYLPLLGFTWIVGDAIAHLSARRRRSAYALVAALAIACAALSLSRSADFVDEEQFWARELELHPDSDQALQFAVSTAVREKRNHDALSLLLRMREIQDQYDRPRARDIRFAYSVADVTARLLPDRATAELAKIDAFLTAVSEARRAELDVLHVRFAIDLKPENYRRTIDKLAPQINTLRATIASRLGDDTRALQLAELARADCRLCIASVGTAVLTYARTGHYDKALAVLDETKGQVAEAPLSIIRERVAKALAARDEAARLSGPAQLQARARELSALELWGRAYDVLAPYKEQIKSAPKFALGFAELAFRAGDTAVAREVLAANIPPGDIDATLTGWAQTMGWVD